MDCSRLTGFVGRGAAMAQVRALLSDSRLVMLTGAGGVGKTGLALQVAASVLPEFPAGVWLVDLAPLTNPAPVCVSVAHAFGLVDSPGRSAMATVTGFPLEGAGTTSGREVANAQVHATLALAEILHDICADLTMIRPAAQGMSAAAPQH